MAKFDYDLGVIGGGAAGLTVTAGAARLGARVLLVEKESRLGGDCLYYGCVPSKTLIKTAQVYHQARTMERFGLPASRIDPVDFAKVAGRIRDVIAAIEPHDSPARFCGLGAMVRQGEAEFIDEHTIFLGTERISARNWVVATGSDPLVPDIPGLGTVPYLTNKDLFSLSVLPSSLVILGAGAIAVEMAQAFARLGAGVTVVQRGDQILSREDRDMAELVQARLEKDGVRFVLGFGLERVSQRGGDIVVTGKVGGTQMDVRGGNLLVALGRKASTDNLGLHHLGIEASPKGLVVDRRMRTVRSNIFAAGDVTGQYQFTHAAGYEAGVVIANTVFRLPRKADYTWMPWCTYTDPELASIGLNEKRARAAGIAYSVWTEEFAANDRALAEGEGWGRLKMLVDDRDRPLGVQICGPHAGELLGAWSMFFAGNLKLSHLAGSVMPYPTLGEINKRVAGSLLGEKLFSDKVRKGLALVFQLKGRAVSGECGLVGENV